MKEFYILPQFQSELSLINATKTVALENNENRPAKNNKP